MRLAVDAHNLLIDRRGIGVYLRAVLQRLLQRGDIGATLVVRDLVPALAKRKIAAEVGTDRFTLARSIPSRSDVAWHPWNGTFFETQVPSVVTIHDCAPFAYPAATEAERASQQKPFHRSAQNARRIIADSRFSRDEIVRHLGVTEERIEVVYLAADAVFAPGEPEFVPEAVRARPYVLFVGANDERKNLQTLLDAWLARENGDVALVCVTSGDVPEAVTVSGLSNTQLRDLYRGATCLAMPSRYEGFGLPPLEAMQSGCPVIASRAASLPEVCGDAALYVDDPNDGAAWKAALDMVVSSSETRAKMRAAGIDRAARFSWDRCAEETLRVLTSVAATPPP
jgi:glycosyltransferase involved in cell wall biosynthesis